jgi:hypothetical protein
MREPWAHGHELLWHPTRPCCLLTTWTVSECSWLLHLLQVLSPTAGRQEQRPWALTVGGLLTSLVSCS